MYDRSDVPGPLTLQSASSYLQSGPRIPVVRTIDAYFRRTGTPLARALRAVSPLTGRRYTHSQAKRMLDLAVSFPAAIVTIPLVAVLAAIEFALHPEESPIFVQHRVGKGGHDLPILKIRSMAVKPISSGSAGNGNTRMYVTRLGGILRRHFLDELPQLAQVMSGQLSVVGIRILPWPIYRGLARVWSPGRYRAWQAAYQETPLGLAGVHQMLRGRGKHDERRFHPDMFYARHASLGLDLYVLWRTLGLTDKPD